MTRVLLDAVDDVAAEDGSAIHAHDRLHGMGDALGLLTVQVVAQVPEDHAFVAGELADVAGQVIVGRYKTSILTAAAAAPAKVPGRGLRAPVPDAGKLAERQY